MRKVLLIMLAVSFFSCKKEEISKTEETKTNVDQRLNPNRIPDSLIVKGSFLVSLNEEKFLPILSEWYDSLVGMD